MQVINNSRPEYMHRLEQLLYGNNYSVSIDLYGPLDANLPLIEVLKSAVNSSCEVPRSALISVDEARAHILESLLYSGDPAAGPIDLPAKCSEITSLVEQLLEGAQVNKADAIYSFHLAKGHPGYPVWWEFALDVHARGSRWILLGCSSD